MPHTVIVERGPANSSAYAPDFPGCVAAAATEVDTIALIQEALALHIEDMRGHGEPIPAPVSFPREGEVAV